MLFDRFLAPPEASAPFEDAALLQGMFDFEAALARAQAACGLIPAAAAQAIASVCRAELHDLHALVAASGRAGSLAIPLVKELQKTVALFSAEAAGVVHKGSTSQDVIDTAMALATQRSLAGLDATLARLARALLALADAHADTPVLARTLMQPAQVTSLGLKFANWAAPVLRAREALAGAAAQALAVQLGGAIGTRSGLGDQADAVTRHMAEALGLAVPPAPWHTQRDAWVRLGLEAAVATGSLGKIATDLALMAQGEIGELAEPSGAGRGGSSAMPHKRNPVGAMAALAAAHRAPPRAAALLATMGQAHERGLGDWQAELAEWPGLFVGAHAAALALAEVFEGLEVDAARMRANIDGLHGLVFAEAASAVLAQAVGKPRAHALLEGLSRDAAARREPLAALLDATVETDPALRRALEPDALRRAFDPAEALKPAKALLLQRLPALRKALGPG